MRFGLAEYLAESESSFVGLMNEKALEIGMHDSSFTNTTGGITFYSTLFSNLSNANLEGCRI